MSYDDGDKSQHTLIMRHITRKPVFGICDYARHKPGCKADQLRGDRAADQRLCFRNMACTTPPLSNYEISMLLASSVLVQPGLFRTWSEIPKKRFLAARLINH